MKGAPPRLPLDERIEAAERPVAQLREIPPRQALLRRWSGPCAAAVRDGTWLAERHGGVGTGGARHGGWARGGKRRQTEGRAGGGGEAR
eukprot:1909387-Prymnesium_polylepis.1